MPTETKYMVIANRSKTVFYNDDMEEVDDYDYTKVEFFANVEEAKERAKALNIDALRTGFSIHWSYREYDDPISEFIEDTNEYKRAMVEHSDPDTACEIALQNDKYTFVDPAAAYEKIGEGYMPYVVIKMGVYQKD